MNTNQKKAKEKNTVGGSKNYGIFYFENSTELNLFWMIKGLHVKWVVEPTKRDTSSLTQYTLEPNTYVYGSFPFYPFSTECTLLVEFHVDTKPTRKKSHPIPDLIPTQTAVDTSFDGEENQVPIDTQHNICKSYLIHVKNKDVIIAARVSTSLFLFSDYSTLFVEPISYRLFPDYKPVSKKDAPCFMLHNNTTHDNIQPITHNKPERKKKIEENLENAISFYSTLLSELNFKMSILVFNELDFKIENFLKKFVFTNFITFYSESKFDKTLKFNDMDVTFDNHDIFGIIVVIPVGKKLNSKLRRILKQLDGFPILFIIEGMDKLSDIYEALLQKEKTEKELMQFKSPMIIYNNNITNRQYKEFSFIVSKFILDVIDIGMYKLINMMDFNEFISKLNKVYPKTQKESFHNNTKKEKEHKIWFFGLKNEIESVTNALNSVHDDKVRKVVCVRKREQFTNFYYIWKESQANFVSDYIGRNLSGLLYRRVESLHMIHSDDMVVLCIELSGRVLITGQDGIFTTFLKEVQKYTKNCILFIDRCDRTNVSGQEPKLYVTEHGTIFGDEIDLQLDEDLRQTQQIEKFFFYRCYHVNKRNCNIDLFWKSVINRNL